MPIGRTFQWSLPEYAISGIDMYGVDTIFPQEKLPEHLSNFTDYEKLSHYNYKKACRLDRIRSCLELLGNPQNKFPSVIIAGTKGKGSTAAILGSILSSAGLKTGIFTSPHLVSLRERIRIGGDPISGKELLRELSLIKSVIEKKALKGLTYFEILTSLAFLYFARKRIDIAVLEVGLGGRLDATNVVHPLAAAITPISYDHTHLLGHSIEKIAWEKCGIIKSETFVVSAPQPKAAEEVIIKTALRKKSRLVFVEKDITCKNLRSSFSGTGFDAKTPYSSYKDLRIPLIGRHQVMNSLAALGIVEILKNEFSFDIREPDIRNGLKKVSFPGRFHIVSRRPYIILDGAHNRASAQSLKEAFRGLFGIKKCLLILGISSDKDIEGIGEILSSVADQAIFTGVKTPRAESPPALAQRLGRFFNDYYVSYDIKDGLTFAKDIIGKKGIILITGSLFLVGEALTIPSLRGTKCRSNLKRGLRRRCRSSQLNSHL